MPLSRPLALVLVAAAAGCSSPPPVRVVEVEQEPQTVSGTGAPSCEDLPKDSPGSERQRHATDMIRRVRGTIPVVRTRLAQARERKDSVASQCQSDKLTQLDKTLRNAEDAQRALTDAISRDDAAVTVNQSAVLHHSCEAAMRVTVQSDHCAGRAP
jgi:hypothetical protein